MTKATVHFNGLVVWQPPAVYKSSCAIDVEFFPYDVQTCVLKLGSWTYDGFKVNRATPMQTIPSLECFSPFVWVPYRFLFIYVGVSYFFFGQISGLSYALCLCNRGLFPMSERLGV